MTMRSEACIMCGELEDGEATIRDSHGSRCHDWTKPQIASFVTLLGYAIITATTENHSRI